MKMFVTYDENSISLSNKNLTSIIKPYFKTSMKKWMKYINRT